MSTIFNISILNKNIDRYFSLHVLMVHAYKEDKFPVKVQYKNVTNP